MSSHHIPLEYVSLLGLLGGQLSEIEGEIDWEPPGIHRGNLITCAGSERVTDRVCSIK